MRRVLLLSSILLILSFLIACGKTEPQPATTSTPAGGETMAGGKAAPGAVKTTAAAQKLVVPAGERIVVRLGQAVGSKISQPGQAFAATVAEPVEINGKVAIPQGAEASGIVAEAVPLGRFKGGAKLRLVLNTVNVGGNSYKLETAAITESAKGKGKRTAVAVGGGAGLGAIVGGLVGGGKGAAIGAAAGAGAGTAGAAFTGNKNIELPAESALSFKLLQPVEMK
ncbi:MAG: hypothetical protein ACR2IF_00320 [Terriglobales bacterium]